MEVACLFKALGKDGLIILSMFTATFILFLLSKALLLILGSTNFPLNSYKSKYRQLWVEIKCCFKTDYRRLKCFSKVISDVHVFNGDQIKLATLSARLQCFKMRSWASNLLITFRLTYITFVNQSGIHN